MVYHHFSIIFPTWPWQFFGIFYFQRNPKGTGQLMCKIWTRNRPKQLPSVRLCRVIACWFSRCSRGGMAEKTTHKGGNSIWSASTSWCRSHGRIWCLALSTDEVRRYLNSPKTSQNHIYIIYIYIHTCLGLCRQIKNMPIFWRSLFGYSIVYRFLNRGTNQFLQCPLKPVTLAKSQGRACSESSAQYGKWHAAVQL